MIIVINILLKNIYSKYRKFRKQEVCIHSFFWRFASHIFTNYSKYWILKTRRSAEVYNIDGLHHKYKAMYAHNQYIEYANIQYIEYSETKIEYKPWCLAVPQIFKIDIEPMHNCMPTIIVVSRSMSNWR